MITLIAYILSTIVVALFVAASIVIHQMDKDKLLFYIGSGFLRLNAFLMSKTIFAINYGGGFNLNFECTREELLDVLPNKKLEPVPMSLSRQQRVAEALRGRWQRPYSATPPRPSGAGDSRTTRRSQPRRLRRTKPPTEWAMVSLV